MQRETKEIVTPGGVKIVLKTWISGREANIVKEAMLKGMKVDPATGKTTEVSGDFVIEQEKILLGQLVVSVDGDTNATVEKLLDLHNTEYQFVIAEVNKINAVNLTPEK